MACGLDHDESPALDSDDDGLGSPRRAYRSKNHSRRNTHSIRVVAVPDLQVAPASAAQVSCVADRRLRGIGNTAARRESLARVLRD